MTGGHLVPLAAILGGVLLINLVITWLLVRWDGDPADLLGSGRYAPENATREADREGDPRSEARSEGGRTEQPRTLETSAGTTLTLTGPGPDEDPPPLDVDGETVVCRHCGAENRPDYRYCRWCVRSGFAEDGSGPTAGASMTDRSL